MKFLTTLLLLAVFTSVVIGVCANFASGLKGSYYHGRNLDGGGNQPVLVRNEAVNFRWNYSTPDINIPNLYNNFSVRWEGSIMPPVTGVYRLGINFDDGDRVWVNDVLVDDRWILQSGNFLQLATMFTWTQNTAVKIKIEYFENEGNALAILNWKKPGDTTFSPIGYDDLRNSDCLTPPTLLATNNITISPSSYFDTLGLYLSSPPLNNQDITYTLVLPHTAFYRFNPCQFTFTKQNWNVPQTLKAWHFGVSFNTYPTTRGYLNFTNNRNADISDNVASVGRTSFPTSRCAYYGQGRLTTFDGLSLSSQNKVGEYYLLKPASAGQLAISIRQLPCNIGSSNSCPKDLTVRYLTGKLVFSIVNNVLQLANNDYVSDARIQVTSYAYGFRIKIADGVLVELSKQMMAADAYFNVNIYVPSSTTYYTGTAGLCGNNNGVKADDLVDMSGNAVPANQFLNAWSVPAANSLIANYAASTFGPYPAGTFLNVPTTYCSAPFNSWSGETVIAGTHYP